MRKGIALTVVVLITACFLAVFTRSSSVKKDSVDCDQSNEKKVAMVHVNSTRTRLVYGSKKKLISDF